MRSKKMKKLPTFLFKNNTETPPWPQWPSCSQPKTLSFRGGEDILKTLNSSFLSTPEELCLITNSSSSEYESFSTTTTTLLEKEEDINNDDSGGGDGGGGSSGECIEDVIRGLRSTERLFFEPGETSSIMEAATMVMSTEKEKEKDTAATAEEEEETSSPTFKERSVVCSMESVDPYLDFKKSMEEMVEAHGLLSDWDCLEELLCWYLKVNGKDNHGYIVGAFVDLLLGFSSTTTTTTTSSSPLSYTCSSSTTTATTNTTTTTTTCSSSLQAAEIVIKDDDDDDDDDGSDRSSR